MEKASAFIETWRCHHGHEYHMLRGWFGTKKWDDHPGLGFYIDGEYCVICKQCLFLGQIKACIKVYG